MRYHSRQPFLDELLQLYFRRFVAIPFFNGIGLGKRFFGPERQHFLPFIVSDYCPAFFLF
nr:hypothetical protein [Hymenobacter busanensis]